jgi:hypothetical protein
MTRCISMPKGSVTDADGVHQIRTLVFTPNPDGSVRQLFQDSDEGKEWKTTFDGHYVRTTQLNGFKIEIRLC